MKGILFEKEQTIVSAEHFRDRKLPALCITQGVHMVVYGYFSSDGQANEFMDRLADLVGAKEQGEVKR